MATYYHDKDATRRTTLTARANTTAYSIGDKRKVSDTDKYWLECTTGGTSAGSAPTWNTGYGATTTDGTVVWTTRGTGDAYTPTDRAFNVHDTLSGASNYNALAAGDILYYNTGTYSVTAALETPINGGINNGAIIHCAYSAGAIAKGGGVIFDGSGLPAATTLYTVSLILNFHFGIKYTAATSHGVAITAAGDGAIFYNCESTNNAGRGFDVAAGAAMPILAYCKITGNTGRGIQAVNGISAGWTSTSACFVICYRCYLYNNGSGVSTAQGTAMSGIFLECYGMHDGTNVNVPFGAYNGLTVAINCLARELGTLNDGTNRFAFYEPASTLVLSLNNIFSDWTNAGAGVSSVHQNGGKLYEGMIVSDNNETRVSTGSIFWDMDAGAPATTDPSYVSATDSTPQADLSGIVYPTAIQTEVAWTIPGFIPKLASGGGLKQAMGGVR